jgi:cysteinyl-tRNA synthetase
VAALFEFVRAANRELDAAAAGAGAVGGAAPALAAFAGVMAVLDLEPGARPLDPGFVGWVEERVAARAAARRARRFADGDRIRAELRARGVEVEDTPTGTKWRLGAGLQT